MSETLFYAKQRQGNERKIILSTATLLVGKAPTKQKRIKMKVRMPLTGNKTVGQPGWVADAHAFVQKSHDKVSPQIELSRFDIHFDDAQLFDTKGTKAPKCSMRGFVVEEVGHSDEPSVDLAFTIYAPFSTRLWNWCGQMGGEEFWAKFEQVESEEEDDLELSSEDAKEEEEVEEEDED